MSNLPIDLNLVISDAQAGALKAKANILNMIDRLNAIDCSDINGSMLSEHRSIIISDLVTNLSGLSPFQTGYITALLELAEYSSNTIELKDWHPSLLTGEWQ